MKKIIFALVYSGLLGMLFLTGCSKDDDNTQPEPETPYAVQYRIHARNNSDVNATNDEMMKTIFLIIANESGTIEEIFDIELSEMLEEYTVDVELTPGLKNIYGFANLTDAMKIDAGLDVLMKGSLMPDLTNVTLTLPNGYEINGTTGNWLPMSKHTQYTVSKLSGQSFRVELIRMLCKVKLSLKNETGNPVALKRLILTPFTNSSIYLMPRDNETPEFPGVVTQADFIYDFDSSYTFEDKEELTFTTYLNETEVTGDNRFMIRLQTLTNSNQDAEERLAVTELSSLNRNDYLALPVILTDYKLEVDVRSYPPIGGYPASVVEGDNEFRINFAGGGPFVISLKLIRLSDNTEVELTNQNFTFDYTDTTPSLFTETPVFNDNEITGIINPLRSGTVTVNVAAEVTSSEGVSRILSYTLYITQN